MDGLIFTLIICGLIGLFVIYLDGGSGGGKPA